MSNLEYSPRFKFKVNLFFKLKNAEIIHTDSKITIGKISDIKIIFLFLYSKCEFIELQKKFIIDGNVATLTNALVEEITRGNILDIANMKQLLYFTTDDDKIIYERDNVIMFPKSILGITPLNYNDIKRVEDEAEKKIVKKTCIPSYIQARDVICIWYGAFPGDVLRFKRYDEPNTWRIVNKTGIVVKQPSK